MSALSDQPHRLWCEKLKKFVLDEVNSPRGMSRIGSLEYRALITLYWILPCTGYSGITGSTIGVTASAAADPGRYSARAGAPVRCTAKRTCASSGVMKSCCWVCSTTNPNRMPPRLATRMGIAGDEADGEAVAVGR